MFERSRLPDAVRAPALALARWTVLFMGWVWLGEQGQRLGWTMANGLLAVAFWWALRLVLQRVLQRVLSWQRDSMSMASLVSGALTVAGVAAIAHWEADPMSFWLLMVVAVFWAVWSAALDAQAPTASRCRRPWAGWPPVVAALITWGTLSADWGPNEAHVAVLLVLCAAVWLAWSAAPDVRLTPRRAIISGLPQTAMGLMMGSLGLSSAWCASAGWSSATVVGLHLLLMATLPGLVRLDWIPRQLPPSVSRLLPLALVMAGGGLLCMAPTLANGLVGMLLLGLAWALPSPDAAPKGRLVRLVLGWAPMGGPALLVAVGVWSPDLGPQALALAFGGLGVLAGLRLLWVATRLRSQPSDKPWAWARSEKV